MAKKLSFTVCIALVCGLVLALTLAPPPVPPAAEAAPGIAPTPFSRVSVAPSPSVAGSPAPSAPSVSPSVATTPTPQRSIAVAGGSAAAAGSKNAEFRGVWVSSVLNLDYPSKAGLSVDKMKAEALSILDKAKEIGFTAVMLQVRPTGDALYTSELFPWSDYLTGTQGKAPADKFDPLAFWVTEAHKRGLELHAWINPFRVTKGSTSKPKHDLNALAATNPARLHPDWTVAYKDGNLYYNPGLPEVRRLIVSGVAELVRNYEIDGIHYDDYFYPEKDFPDEATFQTYGGSFTNRDDWRRENINTLIRDTQKTIADLRPDCRFGVSPFAIWANGKNNSLGSDTNGFESYFSQFADTRKWVKSGWLDYICPQIYWEIGNKNADYQKLLSWWANVVKDTGVDLYVGHASYRAGTGKNATDAWYGAQEIIRQLNLNKTVPEVRGDIHFRFGSFTENTALYTAVRNYYNNITPPAGSGSSSLVMPVTGLSALTVGRPGGNVSTGNAKYYLLGASDPKKPLYLNGVAVENRTPEGFFGVLLELKTGANTFTFAQDGQPEIKRVITRTTAGSSAPPKMTKAEVVAGSCYPTKSDEYRKPGEKVTLKCTAPIGATVTVTVGSQTLTMTPGTKTKPSGAGYFSTTYTCTYTLPASGKTKQIIALGTPTYTMKLDGVTSTRKAGGVIQSVTPGAPYLAEVTSDAAFLYAKNSTSGGSVSELCKGQKDYITAVTDDGAWVRLGQELWVQAADISRKLESTGLAAKPAKAAYAQTAKWDTLTLTGAAPTSARVEYDGGKLVFTVYNVTAAPQLTLPAGTAFSAAEAKLSGDRAVYTLTLAPGRRVEGYFVSLDGGNLVLNIKNTLKAAAGERPLLGIVILVDPGHGGSEPGAFGPLGSQVPEKLINFYTASKVRYELELLGATVLMTRTDDVTVSLNERVIQNRKLRPDLFLSIHGNSLDETVDAASVQGVSTWYKERVAKDFAETLYNTVWSELSRGKRNANQTNLYVCRPTWAPSALIETGFMCSPEDYAWMVDNAAQDKLAAAIAQGILNYFS